jgi:hypothetical protein
MKSEKSLLNTNIPHAGPNLYKLGREIKIISKTLNGTTDGFYEMFLKVACIAVRRYTENITTTEAVSDFPPTTLLSQHPRQTALVEHKTLPLLQ